MADKYEMVNHPSHYNKYDIEVIEMMKRIWGPEAVKLWCEMTAFKYRMRLGEKPENSVEQDLKKENWYLTKAKEYDTKPNVVDVSDVAPATGSQTKPEKRLYYGD